MRFCHYLYSGELICQSDHKPLEDIHLKHPNEAPPRLQRLLLKIHPYNFVIKYVPCKVSQMADALSRLSPNEKIEIQGLDVTIHELTPSYPGYKLSPLRRQHTRTRHFSYLFQQMLKSWPKSCRKLPEILTAFCQWRDDLSIEHSCITWKGKPSHRLH